MTLDELAKEKGFLGETELLKLVSSVILNTPERFKAFEEWKLKDGTKDGLMKLDRKE